ncbi:hypothetical protein EPA93_04550 [Ktedonosporobacter rubrisoli]|uniref:Uncharacterized protein n=1 Tax=Ktedonosporobacter rubrisoli TaxID=2509675 RepID=A0A4P6JKX0_KTERU|nr:hypothetical protein [Ktedonosporobacter rubrisoli]QBD75306.1 hypothetical protein EPA93_04550 [Ktedonosporobacter rubrisoli]
MKPTFCQIFQWGHNVSLLALARESNRHPLLIWALLLGHPLSLDDACIILCAFNELASSDYTLSQLAIALSEKRL